MVKFNKIAVVDVIKITDGAKEQLQKLSDANIVFPETDSKGDAETIERIGDAEATLGSWFTTINANLLENCPKLKYIGICGTSMANIDLNATKNAGATVKNATDYGDEATAEYIFTQLLMLVRGFGKYQWKNGPAELSGKTIGIVGLGAVGQQVAKLALGFDMKVIYYSKSRKPDWESKGLKFCEKEELLKSSDVISLHVPKNLVVLGEKEFSLIRRGAILVDTCLGVVFDVPAFKEWIDKKENFAIFDYSKKGLIDGLEEMENVNANLDIIAGMTIESRERLSQKVLANIKDYLLREVEKNG